MQYLDFVRLISDKESYKKQGLRKGQTGTIINAEIRYNLFFVCFEPENYDNGKCDNLADVYVSDVELIRAANMSDEDILEALPLNNPEWWCKVEDGYILNLKGERKNKIPYDYDS